MKLLALLLALALPRPQDDPSVAPYQNLLLGLKFNYPKTWDLTTNKKSESRILIPIENSSDRAVIEIFPVTFRSETNIWQLTQLGINKTMKRDVERQWEEEILDVPLLLTKVNYSDKGVPRTSETGLIYSFGFNKMMYRITATPDEFDTAEHAWRQVLLSLRTWDGSMPKREDPSVKIERHDPSKDPEKGAPKKGPNDDIPHPTVPHELSGPRKIKTVKAPIASTGEVAGHKVELHLPAEWKASNDKPDVFSLSNPGLAGTLSVTICTSVGAEPAAIALQRVSGLSLNDYTKVAMRDETMPTANLAGAQIAKVWRSGTGAKGSLFTFEATGQSGDFYFILTFRSTDPSKAVAEQRIIEALLERMSVEPAP